MSTAPGQARPQPIARRCGEQQHEPVTGMPTAFTDLVGCRWPLQLAPMGGGVSGPELAVAVCEAGGLGMLSSAHPMP